MTGHPHLTGRLPINRYGGVSRRVIDELPTNHQEILNEYVEKRYGKVLVEA